MHALCPLLPLAAPPLVGTSLKIVMNKAILVFHDPIPILTNNVIEIERD
jgi:hypothetical protein